MTKKTKKAKLPTEETVTLWVVWTESESGGDICNGDENESWPSYEDTYIDAHFKGVYVGDCVPGNNAWRDKSECVTVPKAAFEAIPRSVVYAVIARYRDGGTFASTSGYVFVGGVFGSYDRAQEKLKELETGGGYSIYIPWGGYFSSLESIEVMPLPIINGGSTTKLADGALADW